jgi:hypothetical protein
MIEDENLMAWCAGTKPNCFTAAMIPDVEPPHVPVIAEDSVKVRIVDTPN